MAMQDYYSESGKHMLSIKREKDSWIPWQLALLQKLDIPYLASLEIGKADGGKEDVLNYDISGLIPLTSFRHPAEREWKAILEQIRQFDLFSREMLLDPGNWHRDLQHVYWDAEKGTLRMIYEPAVSPEDPVRWKRSFFLSLLSHAIVNALPDDLVLECYHAYLAENAGKHRNETGKEYAVRETEMRTVQDENINNSQTEEFASPESKESLAEMQMKTARLARLSLWDEMSRETGEEDEMKQDDLNPSKRRKKSGRNLFHFLSKH